MNVRAIASVAAAVGVVSVAAYALLTDIKKQKLAAAKRAIVEERMAPIAEMIIRATETRNIFQKGNSLIPADPTVTANMNNVLRELRGFQAKETLPTPEQMMFYKCALGMYTKDFTMAKV